MAADNANQSHPAKRKSWFIRNMPTRKRRPSNKTNKTIPQLGIVEERRAFKPSSSVGLNRISIVPNCNNRETLDRRRLLADAFLQEWPRSQSSVSITQILPDLNPKRTSYEGAELRRRRRPPR